jgi:hypothetical protein
VHTHVYRLAASIIHEGLLRAVDHPVTNGAS